VPIPGPSNLLHRSLRKPYPVAVRGEGSRLWDATGREYIDFSGSAAVNWIGHGDAEITAAIAEQAAKLEFAHSSQFTTDVAERFAAELIDFAGPAFAGGRVFFTSGGSEATETALKLARQYQVEIGQQNRFRVVGRQQAYHGATLGALAASGNLRRRKIYLPMVKVPDAFTHIGLPYCYRCAYKCGGDVKRDCASMYARELELALVESRGQTAAFIAEPVSGATLGAAVPPDGYWQRIAELCRASGVLLIADEVMTGFGRTGKNFAWQHWPSKENGKDDEAAPDILVLAKGLSSGYLPLGAVIASRKVVEALENGSGNVVHGFTYNAHPLACAAGRAVLKKSRALGLASAADSGKAGGVGAEVKAALESLRDLPAVGDVRGLGLLWGVEFVADRASKAPFAAEKNLAGLVAAKCAERGVLVYPMQGCVDGNSGDHVLIAPPAVITKGEVEQAVAALREAVVAAAAEAGSEG
jgi:adenosylmethionine-8-amino-7-oxononanoate aminotransferase